MPEARRTRSRRGKSTTPWGAFVAIAVLVMLASGIGGYFFWHRSSVQSFDKVSLCPTSGPVGVHAVLVDNSDPLSEIQAQRLTQVVETVAQTAAVGERIDLYILTAGNGAVARPELSLCRPPSDGDPLTQNPERIRRAFVNRFLNPLRASLQRIERPQDVPNSPIMESIKAVCVGAFGTLSRDGSTQLTIASDMIESSPYLNQYKPYDTDAFFRSSNVTNVLANCRRARVDILYLTRPRDARLQTRAHQVFWEKFFDKMNAKLNSMERI